MYKIFDLIVNKNNLNNLISRCAGLECLIFVPPTMESPWSTPTQSEIGEAEAALNAKVAHDFVMDSDPMSHITVCLA